MLCPNCSEELENVERSSQKVLHCKNCGGNFFEENSINRINADDAKFLAQAVDTNIVVGTPKVCPKDSIFLHLMDNNEAIPKNVNLFKCPKCHGIFAYPDDLLKFKKAQNSKIEFFKIWENPLPALKTVLVLSFLFVLSLTALSNLTNRSLQTSHAENIVGTVSFTHEGRYLFVNFHTDTVYISSIVIHDRTAQTSELFRITQKPATIHFTTITTLDLEHDLYYQIVLSDGKGTETRTEERKIELLK